MMLLIALAAVVPGITPLVVTAPSLVDTNQCWYSPRTNALGTGMIIGNGSLTNPWYGDLDAIANTMPAKSTLFLMAGINMTKGNHNEWGDWQPKDGQRIVGLGKGVTVLKRDPSFYTNWVYTLGSYDVNNFSVENLTVDGNANDGDFVMGVVLHGSGNQAINLDVVGCAGVQSNGWEGYSLYLGQEDWWSPTTDSLAENCRVVIDRGTYGDGIVLGGSGRVHNCSVYMPLLDSAGATNCTFFGYNCLYTHDSVFDGNYSYGGTRGFYSDTGTSTNLSVINSAFCQALTGVYIAKQDYVDGLRIAGDVIEVSTNALGFYPGGINVWSRDASGSHPAYNINILDNTIEYAGRMPGQAFSIIVGADYDTNFVGLRVVNNVVDRSMALCSHAQGTYYAGNTDLQGVPLDTRFVNAATNAQTIVANDWDRTIIVNAVMITNMVLPLAARVPGAEITVVNRKTPANTGPIGLKLKQMTVSPAQGNAFSPTNVVYSFGGVDKFISDGAYTWTRE